MIWKLAGTHANAEHVAETQNDPHLTVSVDGEPYRVSSGYYIPYYPSSKDGEDEAVTREKLAIDLTKRFFRNAELGINVRFSREEITELREKYEQFPEASENRRAAGALLVGAMMNRIERLAHALLQNRSLLAHRVDNSAIALQLHDELDLPPSVSLDDTTAIADGAIDYARELFSSVTIDQTLEKSGHFESPHERFKAYDAEIRTLYKTLVSDQELVRCVRRRDRSTDHGGILYDMIRDAGKAEKIPIQTIIDNRVVKIGHAMRDIDRVAESLIAMVSNNQPYADIAGFADSISDFADTAKRRASTKTDYAKQYIDTEITFKVAESDLFNLIKTYKQYALETNATTILEGFNLIQRGIALIDDMAEIRQSRNDREIDPIPHDKPGYHHDDLAGRDVDRLVRDIDHFVSRRIVPVARTR